MYQAAHRPQEPERLIWIAAALDEQAMRQVFYVLANYADGHRIRGSKIRRRPKTAAPVFPRCVWPLAPQYPAGCSFETIHQSRDRKLGRVFHQQVYVVLRGHSAPLFRVSPALDGLPSTAYWPVACVRLYYSKPYLLRCPTNGRVAPPTHCL